MACVFGLSKFLQFVFNLAHMLIKFSYLSFYLYLMTPVAHPKSRLVVYVGIVFVALGGIVLMALALFLCTPIQRNWDKSVPGTCINESGFLFSGATFNMVADVLVFVMPIPTLWSLQRKQRPRTSCLYG